MHEMPLAGVRVIDFTWLGAGPLTTRILADHGAEVIRIESATRPDTLRTTAPFPDGQRAGSLNRSGYFAERNCNKLSVAMNLKHAAARSLVLRLIEQSDIVASNFAPGTLDRLGLGYGAARSVRPDIIYIEMTMQGGYGPDSAVVGFGQTVTALTGLYYLSGEPGRMPAGTGTNFPDHVPVPAHSAFALLAALRHRRRTGQGQYIDVSQAETMTSLLGPAVADFAVNGHEALPLGNRTPDAAPQGVYPCRGNDRWIAISIVTDEQWLRLTEELPAPALASDARLRSQEGRQDHHDLIDQEIGARTVHRDAYELQTRLQARTVPAGVVQSFADLVMEDPQLRHRRHFVRLDHPEMGRSIYSTPPFRLGAMTTPPVRTPAPLLGQHTREVAARLLGLDDAAVENLIAAGVLI